jgi:hypothetical protein
VLPRQADQSRPSLSPDFTSVLLQTAITLHDRQVSSSERWKHLIPLWPALITGLLLIASTWVTARVIHPAQSGRFAAVPGLTSGVLLDTTRGQLCWGGSETLANQTLPKCNSLH